ncbi:heterokaryon incompatibility protein-domain-containing protein [Xylaria sp. CBS 124048]|nr:heterokaryon incompatibility protein-domain-containing protein [Xylaria sp. CBS 124048]
MPSTMHHAGTRYRLCIYCRALENVNEPCPSFQGRIQAASGDIVDSLGPVSGLLPQDAQQISKLKEQPSSLCARCSSYNIIDLFKTVKPLDKHQRRRGGSANEEFLQSRIHLGAPSSLLLTPSCQLCRILYCILPRHYEPSRYDGGGAKSARVPSTGEPDLYIEAYRSYLRFYAWDAYPEDMKSQCAIMLGLARSSSSSTLVTDFHDFRSPHMNGPAICLESRFAAADRTLLNHRPLENSLDTSLFGKALDHCLQNHSGSCSAEKPLELLTARMVDVVERTVIPCPPDCDYIALSYVWGGVETPPQALENRCLPQTIEDAIVITKALGRRYLWVDTLCIDQSPNPTLAQIQAKRKQLDMMSTIYDCATVTIVALTGKNANAGISGISAPRLTQAKENIDGHILFTSPQTYEQEVLASTWWTRAWTMQEERLSRRKLFFTESQVSFSCITGDLCEEMDTTTDPGLSPRNPIKPFRDKFYASSSAQQSGRIGGPEKGLYYYDSSINNYTRRRMTNETDSLNAFRGMLTALSKQAFPQGFIQGLPLRSHPYSLAWVHSRGVTPKRRAMFPTWSWVGWEGEVNIPVNLRQLADGESPSALGIDLELRFLASDEDTIDVEGWLVNLDIRTEPLSEVFLDGQAESIGVVKEGDSLHNNTLKTGHYTCLVIQRHCETIRGRASRKETVFLLALEVLMNQQARRRAMLTVGLFSGQSFDQFKRERRVVQLV